MRAFYVQTRCERMFGEKRRREVRLLELLADDFRKRCLTLFLAILVNAPEFRAVRPVASRVP